MADEPTRTYLMAWDVERLEKQFRDTQSVHREAGLALAAECRRLQTAVRELGYLGAEIAEALHVELGGTLPTPEEELKVVRRYKSIENPEEIMREVLAYRALWNPHEAIRRYRELLAETLFPGHRERIALRDAETDSR